MTPKELQEIFETQLIPMYILEMLTVILLILILVVVTWENKK